MVSWLSDGIEKMKGVATKIHSYVPRPVLVGGAVAIVVVVGALVFGGVSDETAHTNWWIDDDECVNKVAEERDAGQADVKVPEELEFINESEDCDGPARFTAKLGYFGSWEGRVSALRGLGLIGDVLAMADFYDSHGGYTDDAGFERIGQLNDCYIVAVAPAAYAAPGCDSINVGDHLTLYFDDGTSIEALIGDSKGWNYGELDPTREENWVHIRTEVDPQGRMTHGTGWGHGPFRRDDEWHVNILEFWGYGDSGDPMLGDLQKSTGGTMTRLVGVTNHGLSKEFASFAGKDLSMIGVASDGMGRNKSKSSDDAMSECKADRNFSNDTLAAALVSYSYSSNPAFGNDEYPGTELYDEVWTATIHDSYYRSCDRGVGAAVKWSGADDNFNYGGCGNELTYLSGSPLWKLVADNVVFDGSGTTAERLKLEPGDVICCDDHTFAYVGKELAKKGYDSFIKGTDGDTGEFNPDSEYVNASIGGDGGSMSTRHTGPDNAKAPGLRPEVSDGHSYSIYRYVGDYPDKDKYADVGSKARIASSDIDGGPCDCGEGDESFGECTFKDPVSGKILDDALRQQIVEAARTRLGESYTHANAPGQGFDCNGICWWAYKQVGIDIPTNSGHFDEDMQFQTIQANSCFTKNVDELRVGDVVAFVMNPPAFNVTGRSPVASAYVEDGREFYHVALYAGDGYIIEADGTAVVERPLSVYGDDFYGGGCPIRNAEVMSGKSSKNKTSSVTVRDTKTGLGQLMNVIYNDYPYPESGYCAGWVSECFSRAGLESAAGNANDLYYAYCTSTDLSQAKPGMIIATASTPYGGWGAIYGHIGIITDRGTVRHNVGYVAEEPLETFVRRFATAGSPVKWGWMCNVALEK